MNATLEVVELVRKIQAAILAEPESYDQTTYFEPTECGSACCIAGRCVTFHPDFAYLRHDGVWIAKDGSEHFSPRTAATMLGLPTTGPTPALFSSDPGGDPIDLDDREDWARGDWPEPFAERWRACEAMSDSNEARRVRAQIACDRLDYFLETGV